MPKKILLTFLIFLYLEHGQAQQCRHLDASGNIVKSDHCSIQGIASTMRLPDGELLSLIETFKEIEKTSNYENLYLGIVGPGEGAGAMGHAFFVFTQDKGNFLTSKSFQYNLMMNMTDVQVEGNDINHKNGLSLASQFFNSPTVLKMQPGVEIIKTYTAESRVVLLYRVKLDKDKVKKIFSELIDDMVFRYVHGKNDYDVMSNNCLTMNIDILNKYFPEDAKIKTAWNNNSFNLFKGFSLSGITSNIPLALATKLNEHPMFEEPTMLKPDSFYEIKLGHMFIGINSKIGKLCKWSEDKVSIYNKLVINPVTRRSDAFLKNIKKDVSSCPSAKSDYNEMIELIAFMSVDIDDRMRIMGFQN